MSSLDISLWDNGVGILTLLLDNPPNKGSASSGTLSHLPRIPGLLYGLLLPWPVAVVEVTGLTDIHCSVPSRGPSLSITLPSLWGFGGLVCRGQRPPQPVGSLPHGHWILVPITGCLLSSKHPGDASMGVHSPALCLRARQHFVILIYYFS